MIIKKKILAKKRKMMRITKKKIEVDDNNKFNNDKKEKKIQREIEKVPLLKKNPFQRKSMTPVLWSAANTAWI